MPLLMMMMMMILSHQLISLKPSPWSQTRSTVAVAWVSFAVGATLTTQRNATVIRGGHSTLGPKRFWQTELPSWRTIPNTCIFVILSKFCVLQLRIRCTGYLHVKPMGLFIGLGLHFFSRRVVLVRYRAPQDRNPRKKKTGCTPLYCTMAETQKYEYAACKSWVPTTNRSNSQLTHL